MKLVMKADDGKEIVYISGDGYDIGYVDESPDNLIIELLEINPKHKEYLENIIKENLGKNLEEKLKLKLKLKGKEFTLITPCIYFTFEEELYDMINEELKINNQLMLSIGCRIKIDNEYKLCTFFTTDLKKNEN